MIRAFHSVRPDRPGGQRKETPEVATCTRPWWWVVLVIFLIAAAASCTALVLAVFGVTDSPARPAEALDDSTRSSLEVFSSFDANGDGFLNYSELVAFRRGLSGEAGNGTSASALGGDPSPWPQSATDPVAEYLLLADTDLSGGVDFGEFASTGIDKNRGIASCDAAHNASSPEDGRRLGRRLLEQQPGSADIELEQRMLRMWDGGFDADGNGRLDRAELELLLSAQNEVDLAPAVARLLEELDGDADGQLSEEELSRQRSAERASRAPRDGLRVRGVGGRGLSEACNGHASLCGKRLDEVAFATTHNSFNNAMDGYWYPNQYESMLTQLEDGIRGFMIDLHVRDDVVYLCHGGEQAVVGFCPLGKEPAAEALEPVAAWLKQHPGEVVAFIIELGTSSARPTPAQLSATWKASGLDSIMHQLDAEPWPTLGQMVSSNKRAVLVMPHSPWLCGSAWSHTDRASMGIQVGDSSVECGSACSALQPPGCGGRLHVMHHYISYPAARGHAKQLNFREVLSARVGRWVADHGRIPNFVAVDFYEIGNVLQVVDDINGVPQRPWACRTVGKTDFLKRHCCPSGMFLTSCGVLGSCDKGSGQCRCNENWERGFDCSRRVCRHGSKCSRWSWRCWSTVPGCCAWQSFTWWC